MNKLPKMLLVAAGLLLLAGVCVAQFRGRGGGRGGRGGGQGPIWRIEGGGTVDERTLRTAREIETHSTDTPVWTNSPGFAQDVFTFARIIRDNDNSGFRGGNWATDFPDSDLNLSFRLQQMTSLRVDPNGRVLRLTNPDLFNYPWIYMVEVGTLQLRNEEVLILRKYLQNGGVLMADDFWGDTQWEVFATQMKRVLPDKEFEELPMEHPMFHSVFPLNVPKNKLQTPGIYQSMRSTDVTWERHYDRDGNPEDCSQVHVRAIKDDKGRIMVIATHNTDNGDSWEREGEDDFFFHEFSEKRGFPLGINIIFYIMTH